MSMIKQFSFSILCLGGCFMHDTDSVIITHPTLLTGPLRGKSELIPPGATQTLISLQTESKYAEILAVQIDAAIPPQPGPGVFNRPVAEIIWGVEGARHSAVIDVNQGTAFTVLANMLIVNVTNPSFGAFTSTVAVAASV